MPRHVLLHPVDLPQLYMYLCIKFEDCTLFDYTETELNAFVCSIIHEI